MDWLVRFIQISCWIEIISMHVNAQQALSLKPFHGPDWQNWDELDLQTRLFSSNHNGWTRNRLAIGGRKALNERTTVNLYYQRQNDGHSSPRVINAVVVLIELRLR
jgi:hypothetical protein